MLFEHRHACECSQMLVKTCSASVPKGVEVRFYKWCDILLHDAANTIVKFNKDYTMDVTTLDSEPG